MVRSSLFLCFVFCFGLFAGSFAIAGDNEADATAVRHFMDRSFIFDKPSLDRPAGPLPLIIVLHGATGNALSMKRSIIHHMRQEMDRHGFMVAWLNGSPGRFSERRRTWNAGVCCGPASRRERDDVGYIKSFIEHAVAELGADPGRIYLLGYSNGAMMSYRYICEYPETVTAMVVLSGTLMADRCNPNGLKGVLHIHGGDDLVVPIEGGVSKVGLFRREYYTPVSDIDTLMKDAGVPFTFRLLEEMGHQLEKADDRINVPATAWRFFHDKKR